MATEGAKQIFWALDTLRYIKLEFDAFPANTVETIIDVMQMSQLNFIDLNDTAFKWSYDDVVCIDHSSFLETGVTEKWYTKDMGCECAERLFDMTTDTKFCALYGKNGTKTLPFYVTFDLGSACLDIAKFSRYQWWTANDTAKYPHRSPTSWKLFISTDGVNFALVDKVENYANLPTANNSIAYTSKLLG